MTIEAIIFYILAATILFFSVLSVTSKKVLRATVYLLFVLGTTSALYFMLNYFYLAAVQLIVYVGGIVVLIIFSILLTSHINERLPMAGTARSVLTALVSVAGALVCLTVILAHPFVASSTVAADDSVMFIGQSLLNYGTGGYVLPFEVISILLLAAMIAAIVIAKRENKHGDIG